MKKPITFKIDEAHLKLLDKISKATQIPKSTLIRKGIHLIILQMKEDVLTLNLRHEIDSLLTEDRELLDKLSKA